MALRSFFRFNHTLGVSGKRMSFSTAQLRFLYTAQLACYRVHPTSLLQGVVKHLQRLGLIAERQYHVWGGRLSCSQAEADRYNL